MGLIYNNPFGPEWEGIFGDMVFAKFKPGIKIGRRKPTRTKAPTAAETASQAQFRAAMAWAKAVWATQPELKARYHAAAQRSHGRGFDLAKSDYRLRPVVEDIDLAGYTGHAGEVIRVRAVKKFEVKAVGVKIRDLSGAVLEEGAAVPENGWWAYTAQVEVPAGQTVVIEATATDHPGHTGVNRVDHACGPRSPQN
jgi:hypothetical protein